MPTRIIITGATGMVGSELVRQALADEDIDQVTVLARRSLPIVHNKLKQLEHKDFANYAGLEQLFKNNDACIWCLGISQSRVSKKEYAVVTHDYTVAAATAMLHANPDIAFGFLSGEGADSSEKSRVRFARVKGQAENALLSLPFKHVWIFRPGGIIPVHRDSHEGLYKKFEIRLVKLMKALVPSMVIDTVTLTRAMLKAVKEKDRQKLFTHAQLKRDPAQRSAG